MEYSLNLGDIYAILTALCWSSAVICFDIAGRVLNSIQISLLKNIVGVSGFVAVLLIQSDPFPLFTQHEYLILIISGFIGVAMGDILFLASLRRIGSGMSAIISTSYSVLVFILAYIMYQEVISLLAYLGGVLVISGVIIGTMERPENRTKRRSTSAHSTGLWQIFVRPIRSYCCVRSWNLTPWFQSLWSVLVLALLSAQG